MNRRFQALGVAWVVWSATFSLLGAVLGLAFAGFTAMLAFVPDSTTGQTAPGWLVAVFGGFSGLLSLAFVAYGLVGIVVGVFLYAEHRWARFAALVLAVTQLSNWPIGAILAIATFVCVFWPDPDPDRPQPAG